MISINAVSQANNKSFPAVFHVLLLISAINTKPCS